MQYLLYGSLIYFTADPSSRKRPPEDSSNLESGEGGPPVKKPAGNLLA